jgi:flagellar biosynthesis/type III secretory pathway protein FliH
MCDSKGVIDMADETGGIKELRDAADRGREAIQERDQLKREVAFMKAGVDTDSKAGQLLFKAYDGELETESIQAEWQELVPTPVPVEEPEPAQEIVDETDTQVAEQRQALAEDSVSVEAGTQSPYEQGFQEFKKAYDEGSPKEDSAARFVHTVLEAASQGDERVISGR